MFSSRKIHALVLMGSMIGFPTLASLSIIRNSHMNVNVNVNVNVSVNLGVHPECERT